MWFLLGLAALLYLHYRLDRHYLGNEAENLLDGFRLRPNRYGIVSLRKVRKPRDAFLRRFK